MKKEFEYEGYRFLILIEFNVRVERRIGGNRWSKITLSHLGSAGFTDYWNVLYDDIVSTIPKVEAAAQDWVRKRNGTDVTIQSLKYIGFS